MADSEPAQDGLESVSADEHAVPLPELIQALGLAAGQGDLARPGETANLHLRCQYL